MASARLQLALGRGCRGGRAQRMRGRGAAPVDAEVHLARQAGLQVLAQQALPRARVHAKRRLGRRRRGCDGLGLCERRAGGGPEAAQAQAAQAAPAPVEPVSGLYQKHQP